jgi:hypothetical protein
MKLKQLSLLCAVACAAFAGQANAQVAGSAAQAVVDDANANGRVVYISGASAVQGGLGQIAQTLFTGTNYYFTGSSASDYRAYAGKLAVAAGGWPAGSNVIIINRAKGGSVQGVNPVARAESIESLNVSTAGCATGAGTSASPFVCGLNTRVPDAGVSDVAPALFDDVANTEGEPAQPELNEAELASLTATPLYGLAFGVPVTKNLPLFNLNKSALSAIMTGNVGTWDAVDASLPASDIIVCRRVNGSGTQAVANLYYGNYPCGSTVNFPADRYASEAWNEDTRTFTVEGNTGGLVVIENSTSGDVRACLNAAVNAKNSTDASGYVSYVTKDRAGANVTVKFKTGVDHHAVGVLSMDSLSSSTAAGNWQFRSLDGAGTYTQEGAAATPVATGTGRFPTKASYIDGTWDMQGWISFNLPTRTTGNKAAVLSQFVAAAKNPAVLAAQSGLKHVAAAIPGTPDAAGTGQVLRAGYVGGDQCAPLNRNF